MIENLNPRQAWDLLQQNADAVLVDVRTKVEHAFVGHPVSAIHIAWKEAPDWQVNSAFVAEVKKMCLITMRRFYCFVVVVSVRWMLQKRLKRLVFSGLLILSTVLKAPWISINIEVILAAGVSVACLGSRVNLYPAWIKFGLANKI